MNSQLILGRQYFSPYRAVSQRQGERGERIEASNKNSAEGYIAPGKEHVSVIYNCNS